MTVPVGVGVMIAALVSATVLGIGVRASSSPAPPAAPTGTELDRKQEMARLFPSSRDTERTDPTSDPLTATGEFAQHMRTFAPPTPPPVSAGSEEPTQPPPSATATASPGKTEAGGGPLPELLLLIRANESGGNYQAFNATGCTDEDGVWSCGGAYQLSEHYAAGWAAEAGYPGQSSHAETWDPAVQDAVALYKFYASNPDGTLWCNYTDYC